MTLPRLHVVTDDTVLARPEFEEIAGRIAARAGDRVALHLRGPRTAGRLVYEAAVRLGATCRDAGTALLINDRIDVALTAGSAGVHLGARSLPVSDARSVLERGWIGSSVHTEVEAAEAGRSGADYLFVGPVFPTASHPDAAGIGVAWGARIADAGRPLPWLAIGGVSPESSAAILDAGAHGVAVLRGVWDGPDPVLAVEAYLSLLDDE